MQLDLFDTQLEFDLVGGSNKKEETIDDFLELMLDDRANIIYRCKESMTTNKSGCWIPIGLKPDRNGYVAVSYKGKRTRLHRLSYEYYIDPIRTGYAIDHVKEKCSNRACFNPDHLEQVTHSENTIRAHTGNTYNRNRKTYRSTNIYGFGINSQSDGFTLRWSRIENRIVTHAHILWDKSKQKCEEYMGYIVSELDKIDKFNEMSVEDRKNIIEKYKVSKRKDKPK